MAKQELKKKYAIKLLKESLIIFFLFLSLILLALKFGESPISFLLRNLGLNIIFILIFIFLIVYFITYYINYTYNKMDIKSKENIDK